MKRTIVGLGLVVALVGAGCQRRGASGGVSPKQTFAELRTIKGALRVSAPGEPGRTPYRRERIVEGEAVDVPEGGLAWMRRDGGATWLISGPAQLVVKSNAVELRAGRAFVDGEQGEPVSVVTPKGALELSDARASVEVGKQVTAYVLRGTARSGDAERASAGELLTLLGDGKVTRSPMLSWQDWTGGLGTADASADPAPFGIGTVGARKPGDQGQPRFSLVIQRLDVKVTIDHDFAVTEVDQTFVNPSVDTVEGIFSFRTPIGGTLQRFGVDRDGELVWGRVKESQEAVRQYESNVYQGSQEDPALLQWRSPGVYDARLYPIKGGTTRRVVTRYAEWLSRQGQHGERRLYVYPMAAEGAKGSLPRIEELTVKFDLSQAAASSVRAGMGGTRNGNELVVKAFDFTPRADLSVELFDNGQSGAVAYRAPHDLPPEEAPESGGKGFARDVSREEADYIAIPLRAPAPPAGESTGLDLALVIDTSAATEPSALAISRTIASSLLAHLGSDDRAALWAGDATLRPVAEGSGSLTKLDADKRKQWLAGLSAVERGGATDIGALLTQAASKLDPKRHGAVLYVGDGVPSVGELAPKVLSERLARLPTGTRLLAAAVGSQPNLPLLASIVRGAPVEQVSDAYGAARSALRLLEAAGRSSWLGAKVDLGPSVERVLPRVLPPITADETTMIVGRVNGAAVPSSLELSSSEGSVKQRLAVRHLRDYGDLRRRWAEERFDELRESGAGRASLVDIGRRFGLVTPFTSLYVPTRREREQEHEDKPDLVSSEERREERARRWRPWWNGKGEPTAAIAMSAIADNKEGGTGTRAKGEEGSMGSPVPLSLSLLEDKPNEKQASAAPRADGAPKDAPQSSRREMLEEAKEFGMIDLRHDGDELSGSLYPEAPAATVSPSPAAKPAAAASPPMASPRPAIRHMAARSLDVASAGAAVKSATGGGLGLSGIGAGPIGDSSPKMPTPKGVASIGELALSGGSIGNATRVVAGMRAGFRACYHRGLVENPDVSGRIQLAVRVGVEGEVAEVTPSVTGDLPPAVISCVVARARASQFERPDNGSVIINVPVTFDTEYRPPPPDDGDGIFSTKVKVSVTSRSIGVITHERAPCGKGADLPLSERLVLWRERLGSSVSIDLALRVYRAALADCEASDWRERSALLVQIVDSMGSIRDRVALWRALLTMSPTAADAVYRFMLLRVQTSQDLKELHEALGLTQIEPQLLDALLKKAKDPAERLALLRGAAEKFANDTELSLLVLDAYEDAGDEAGGRAWARKLRRRADASSHVRTNVGEYYLRLSGRAKGAQSERDTEEARRTFGELVEFAPEDPLSRRRLGDLLRAHGWYEEARRQYETLAALTPDDASVPLLLAAANQGTGKVEEAVRWAEKAAATGSPDGESQMALAARALASAFLCWARQDSARDGNTLEVERLRGRAARLAASEQGQGVRVILSWAHPELRPALWSNALGSMMPAPDNLPLLGVAQVFVPSTPTPEIELHLDPEDAARAARLELKATLTVLVAEGTPQERLARLDVAFKNQAGRPLDRVKLRFEDGALKEIQ
ncbi:MAG TPA: VIT domain-containing protein [Polyangiaceae bacterium]|nr:VIT domain-containing protein [Polyangiaceae bacterium]